MSAKHKVSSNAVVKWKLWETAVTVLFVSKVEKRHLTHTKHIFSDSKETPGNGTKKVQRSDESTYPHWQINGYSKIKVTGSWDRFVISKNYEGQVWKLWKHTVEITVKSTIQIMKFQSYLLRYIWYSAHHILPKCRQ